MEKSFTAMVKFKEQKPTNSSEGHNNIKKKKRSHVSQGYHAGHWQSLLWKSPSAEIRKLWRCPAYFVLRCTTKDTLPRSAGGILTQETCWGNRSTYNGKLQGQGLCYYTDVGSARLLSWITQAQLFQASLCWSKSTMNTIKICIQCAYHWMLFVF